MPEEVVGIIVIALAAFTALSIVLMVNVRRYLETKDGLRGGGSSITTSELEEMLDGAARDAMKPLLKRIENLEAVIADADENNLLADTDTYFESTAEKDGVRIVSRSSKS